jgi:hypothetical protein
MECEAPARNRTRRSAILTLLDSALKCLAIREDIGARAKGSLLAHLCLSALARTIPRQIEIAVSARARRSTQFVDWQA